MAGNIVEAERMLVKAMKSRKKIFGQEHEETLNSMALVGKVYKLSSRWDKAEKLFMQVI
jgi:hypothetical protein